MILKLKRTYQPKQTLSKGSVINSKDQEVYSCVFLELPWLDNQRQISCIPEGRYQAIKHKSPTFGASFWLQQVPGRSEILIHFGNYAASKNPKTGTPDTRGCILPGARFADIDGDGYLDVTSSKATMDALYLMLPDKFEVVIEKA